MSLEVTLITGRTVSQGEAMERGKDHDGYTKAAAVCHLDPADMEKIGVTGDDVVRVSTDTGGVILRAVKSREYPHEGIIFVPLGPWVNSITDMPADSTGMPPFRGIPARIEHVKGEKVLSSRELIEKLYPKRKAGDSGAR